MSSEPTAAISITLPMRQITKLQERAQDEGRKVSHVIRDGLDFFLDRVPSSSSQDAAEEPADIVAATV